MNFHNSMPTDRRMLLGMIAGSLATLLGSADPLMAAGPAPFSSGRLQISRRGALGPAGRDIVLIPGLASGPAIWNGLADRLPGHRLHLVHVAGFARLPAGANASGPLLTPLADELALYIRSRSLRAPVLIGHSMGGTLAMLLGLRPTPSISRIMVVDMLPEGAAMLGGTAQGFGYLAEQLSGYFTDTKAGRQLLARMVAETPGGRGSDPRVIARALTELAQTNLTTRLGAIRCPLEVVYALPADPDLQRQQRQRYRRAYARVRQEDLIGIGPSGHMLMLDQPQKFAATVARFLK